MNFDLQYILSILNVGLVRGAFYALTATGLSLVFGVMNIPNFAHGEMYMLGAYFSYFAYSFIGLPPSLSILAGGVGGFLAGGIIEKLFFRPLRNRAQRQREWIMNTFLVALGLSFILKNLAQLVWGVQYRGITHYWEGKVNLGLITVSVDRIVAFLLSIVAIGLFALFLRKTMIGKGIRAVAQKEIGAKVVGININLIHNIAFALSGLLAGLAGGALLSIRPASPHMGLTPLFNAWFVVILVGLGNIRHVIWGGIIVGLIETFAYQWVGGGWQKVVSLALIATILLVKPRGIFGSPVKGIWEQ